MALADFVSPQFIVGENEVRLEGEQLELLFNTFFEITSLVHAEGNDQALVTKALGTCSELLQADSVMLFRVRGTELQRYSIRRTAKATLQIHDMAGSEALSSWLSKEAQPFAGPAGEFRLPLEEPFVSKGDAALVCAPLIGKTSQLGLLVAMRDLQETGFNDDNLKLLTLFANQLGIALENIDLYERLHRDASTDGLTGIHNYRSLMSCLETELNRARRHDQIFAFVMADVDHLKRYNETFGHIAGSQALAEMAKLLEDNSRTTDIVGKYGGDEFGLVLPQTGQDGACAVSERIRAAIEVHQFKHIRPGDLTCSFGVAIYPTDATDAAGLIRTADRILFAAKHSGKNVVLTSKDSASSQALDKDEAKEPAGTSKRETGS